MKAIPITAFLLFVAINLFSRADVDFPLINQVSISDSSDQEIVKPTFPGGDLGLMKFIESNLVYPDEALANLIEGRLFAQFTVNEDGGTSNIKILVGLPGGCSNEAVRVLKKMPRWNPATLNGVPVKFDFTIPILFRLDKPRPMNYKRKRN